MSYRGVKRLLGETSLERKCRFLFGTATFLLITGSFWFYAWNTENLAYQQAEAGARLVVGHALAVLHAKVPLPPAVASEFGPAMVNMLESLPDEFLGEARFDEEIITPKTKDPDKLALYRRALEEGLDTLEAAPASSTERQFNFPLRLGDSCLNCHKELQPEVKKGDLVGVATIKISSKDLESRIHRNRALLLSTAIVSALALMGGSWLIVRYVIVKPVQHLKDVSDAITAGQLNIRSEIQTGDEFEDLSHAFNRMLRTLVSMQDQLRRVNNDLDRKVDELAQANMALYTSFQLKSDFLSTMSHELRTPLNSILGFGELLASQKISDKQRKWAENIISSGRSLLALINDILDLAKIEAGKMQLRVEEFSVREVCEGLLNMFRPQADKKNIDLDARIDPGLPPLKQDASKLQQILWNLLSNAVKFTPEGGRVTLQADTDGLHLILRVIDTGVGIAPEDQEIIFEKFRQAGNTLTREHAGTGLGLSIVREVAKLLGGEVKLQSELGRGSTFTVTVPLVLNPEPRLSLDLTPPPPPLPRDVRFFGSGIVPTTTPDAAPGPNGNAAVGDGVKEPRTAD
ncbi:MAG TPA: ATP-binding protein [Gemmatales bacterium]|nr:ATP-binding protein [Gemmatales bacterium]HMP58137.1 ATP-binding protein [Gemmatales bacterium]